MKPTCQKALDMMEDRGRVCGIDMIHGGVGNRYSARIGDLKDAGFDVVSGPCTNPGHSHHTRVYEYWLVPAELVLFEPAG